MFTKSFLTIVLFCAGWALAAVPPAQLISVTSPNCGADVKGETKISLSAPTYKTVTATCWKQGDQFGKETQSQKLN